MGRSIKRTLSERFLAMWNCSPCKKKKNRWPLLQEKPTDTKKPQHIWSVSKESQRKSEHGAVDKSADRDQ